MAFINNGKFQEIRQAAKEGNEKAKMILQAMRKMAGQDDIDRLVNDYYGVGVEAEEPIAEDVIPESTETVVEETETPVQEIPEELQPEVAEEQIPDVVDLTDVLDKETDGLFDEPEIEDTSFVDFINNKRRDGLRNKKGAEYFGAYDLQGRQNYVKNKLDSYKNKFNGRIRDIDRRYNDINTSLNMYSTKVNDMLDDGLDIDMDSVNQAYDDFTGSPEIMHSFGRHWDENDTNDVVFALNELVKKYGKNNIMAALNTLKSDNENHKKFLNNQIDTEIGRYSKSVENILK